MDTVDDIDKQANLQKLLEEGFASRNLQKFKDAILKGAQLNIPLKDDDSNRTMYEKVLSTFGYYKYVHACITAGCEVNYKNPNSGKAAIHFAAESQSPLIFKELLDHKTLDIDCKYNGETVLHMLVKSIDEENSSRVVKSIRRLLQGNASPNLRDNNELTPLENVLNNQQISIRNRCDLVYEFVANPTLDFVLYRRGVEFLLKNSEDFFNKNDNQPYEMLVRHLMEMSDDGLRFTLKQYEQNHKGWDRKKMHQSILLAHISDPNKNMLEKVKTMISPKTPMIEREELVMIAIENGSWSTVLALLEVKHIKTLPRGKMLLYMIALLKTDQLLDYSEYENCLKALLKDHKDLLIKMDDFVDDTLDSDDQFFKEIKENSALHNAVLFRNDIAIRVFLCEGARLGTCNLKGNQSFEDIELNLLKEHFDNCITSRGNKPSNKDYEIIINLMNLTDENNALDMKPIAYMAKNPDLSPLLLHPLITCFLHFKWDRLVNVFSIHFLVFVLFLSALVAHILLRFPTRFHAEYVIIGVVLLCFVYILYMLVIIGLEYWFLKVLPYWLDIPLILLVALTCFEVGETEDMQRAIAVVAILLMGLKLFTLIGTLPLPSVVTHMLILKQVTYTFLKSLFHYFIFPLTFALAFYLIFSKSTDTPKPDECVQFSDKPGSVLKMITMFHGVIDSSDFIGYWGTIVIILFMFMTMILTNLLSALAVSDTQKIEADVELNAAIYRVNQLVKYESIMNKHWNAWISFIFFILFNIRKDQTSYGYISIRPNNGNIIKVYNKRLENDCIEDAYDSDDEDDRGFIEPNNEDGGSESDTSINKLNTADEDNHGCTTITIKPQKLDGEDTMIPIESQTVNRALEIIRNRSSTDAEKNRQDLTVRRIDAIYNKLYPQNGLD